MADVFSKQKRSEVMARIRSRGNRDTELALVKVLRAQGITGWRRHLEIHGRAVASVYDRRSLRTATSGAHRAPLQKPTFRVKPDFVFLKSRTAIFVDGCFWHSCPKHATKPKNNRAFWRRKLSANKARDALVTRTLLRAGWRVFRIWEHELPKRKVRNAECGTNRLVRRIRRALSIRD